MVRMSLYNNRKSHESLLIKIYALAVVGLARPDAEGNAKGGPLVHASIGLLHLGLIQFVLR